MRSQKSGNTNRQTTKSEGTANEPKEGEPGSTDRLLVLSDGLFAIAITLLVLDLKVPKVEGTNGVDPSVQQIGMAFLHQWPTYFAYVMSFLNIGILWNNHVTVFRYIRRTDHTLTMLNTLLMLGISTIPFVTSVLAEYLVLSPAHRQVAMLIYSGAWFIIAIVFNALWFYAAAGRRLLDQRISASHYQDVSKRYKFGPAIYLVMFLLAIIGLPIVSLVLSTVLSLFYALPYNASKVMAEAELLEGETERRLVSRVLRRRR